MPAACAGLWKFLNVPATIGNTPYDGLAFNGLEAGQKIERHVKVPVISIPKLGGDLHTPEDLVAALEAHS